MKASTESVPSSEARLKFDLRCDSLRLRKWRSLLRGGGNDTADGGKGARARKQKEQKLLDALAQFLSNFVNEGEEPNTKDAQQSQSSDGTKYFDLAQEGRTSRPSRAKRRQLKRSQAEGGIIGALQKTIIRYKEGQDIIAKLAAIVEKARIGKLHPGRTQEQEQKT